MQFSDLNTYFDSLSENIMNQIPDIIAETATEYFKETFSTKGFDGNPWKAGKAKKTGSLLVSSGSLMNSIHPTLISRQLIIISAGNDKVPYAKVHNEGSTGAVIVPAHSRSRKGKTQQVKAYTFNQNIPQRQFMGNAVELRKRIRDRVIAYVNHVK